MKTYKINTEFFKKCLRAVSREENRYYITGVYIHDKEGIRPLSAGPNEPHIFRKGDEMEVVIMPMRI